MNALAKAAAAPMVETDFAASRYSHAYPCSTDDGQGGQFTYRIAVVKAGEREIHLDDFDALLDLLGENEAARDAFGWVRFTSLNPPQDVLASYWARGRGEDDGQPTEAQEWADYDRDC